MVEEALAPVMMGPEVPSRSGAGESPPGARGACGLVDLSVAEFDSRVPIGRTSNLVQSAPCADAVHAHWGQKKNGEWEAARVTVARERS